MATPSTSDPQRARHRNRRGSRIRRRRNKRSPKSMRLIDADVVTTDKVSFERIGDFENSSAPRRRQGTCGSSTIYVSDQHRSLLLRPAKPWQRGSKVTVEEGPVLGAKRSFVRKQNPVTDKTK